METVLLRTFVYLLLVHVIRSHNVEVSKACYGTQGPQNECTRHELDCKNGKLAIQDAFYSYNSSCLSTGLGDCGSVVVKNLTYDKRAEFNETLTEELYRRCSLNGSCKFDAGRKGAEFNFSVLKYICINEPKVLCNDETFHAKNTSLLWMDTSISNVDQTCSCNISTTEHEAVVIAYDMRPQTACRKLSITTNGDTKPNCQRLISYQLLTNSTIPIVLKPINGFKKLWISIMGAINGSCTKQKISQDGQSSITILPTPFANISAPKEQENTRAIAGAVTVVILVCIIVAGVLVWFTFIRNKTQGQKSETGIDKYVVAGSASTAVQRRGNYDYATINDGVDPIGRAQNNVLIGKALMEDDYNHINHHPPKGDTSSGYDTTASAAAAVKKLMDASSNSTENDDYSHIDHNPQQGDTSSGYDTTASAAAAVKKLKNASSYSTDNDDYSNIDHNPQQGDTSSGYDTTASAAAAVKKLKNASSNSTDNDDYNHLRDGKPSGVSSDYDTTVSASKAVAQFGEMKDSEDDCDHFKRSEDRVIDSPYDTANHHSSVSADTTPNPYDLAK